MTVPARTTPEFHIDSCCWHAHGWEMASEFSVQDATRLTRGQARQRFAHSYCSWTEVGVWKRYIRPFDRQEQYEWWVENNDWRDDWTGGGWDTHPDIVPEDWQPDTDYEAMPYWQFCLPSHPDARAVWICGLRKDGAPLNPRRANAS